MQRHTSPITTFKDYKPSTNTVFLRLELDTTFTGAKLPCDISTLYSQESEIIGHRSIANTTLTAYCWSTKILHHGLPRQTISMRSVHTISTYTPTHVVGLSSHL